MIIGSTWTKESSDHGIQMPDPSTSLVDCVLLPLDMQHSELEPHFRRNTLDAENPPLKFERKFRNHAKCSCTGDTEISFVRWPHFVDRR